MATNLMHLGDDALLCVVLANDRRRQDALFLGLVCKRFLARVGEVLEADDLAFQKMWCLPRGGQVAARTMRTTFGGAMSSEARIKYCCASFRLSLTLGWSRNPLEAPIKLLPAPRNLGTGHIYHLVKWAPVDFLMHQWLLHDGRKTLNLGPMRHPRREDRALVMFAAVHNRLDVLIALYDHGALSSLFEADMLEEMLGMSDHHINARAFEEAWRLLIKPALIHRRRDVYQWWESVVMGHARRLRMLPLAEVYALYFGPLRIVPNGHAPHGRGFTCSWHAFAETVKWAARANDVSIFLEALTSSVHLWKYDTPYAFSYARFTWTVLAWVWTSGFGRGELAEALVAFCNEEAEALRLMFGIGGEQPWIDLEDLQRGAPTTGVNMHLTAEFCGSETAFLIWQVGDPQYTRWLLKQIDEQPVGGFFTRQVPRLVSRQLNGPDRAWARMNSTREMVENALKSYNKGKPGTSVPEGRRECNMQSKRDNGGHDYYEWGGTPERWAFYNAVPLRPEADFPGHPSWWQCGLAVALEHWLVIALPETDARFFFDEELEFFAGMLYAQHALLPAFARLCDEHAASGVACYKLRQILILYFDRLFMGLYEIQMHVALGYASIGYKHGLLTRDNVTDPGPLRWGREAEEKVHGLYHAIVELWDAMDAQ